MSNKQAIEILDDMIKLYEGNNGNWNADFILGEAKSRIQSLPDTDEWISVNDRIPDEGKTFIYLTGNGKVMVCSNRTLDDWFIRKYAVTHWVYPIPSPITK